MENVLSLSLKDKVYAIVTLAQVSGESHEPKEGLFKIESLAKEILNDIESAGIPETKTEEVSDITEEKKEEISAPEIKDDEAPAEETKEDEVKAPDVMDPTPGEVAAPIDVQSASSIAKQIKKEQESKRG